MIETALKQELSRAFAAQFGAEVPAADISLQPTRREFAGSHTLVCFPYLKISRTGPEQTAGRLGEWLSEHSQIVGDHNVVKGFLNLSIKDSAWLEVFREISNQENYGTAADNGQEVMIEYSSPNTNKPLHLGHLRNNFLGWSVAEILKANGFTVHKVQIINDRGIHICKSMVAWQHFGNGETPETTGKKGDKLVGDYYVRFDKEYSAQVEQLTSDGMEKEEAKKKAPIMEEAQEMLRRWEQKDPEAIDLWQKMNGWVYKGFSLTYQRMGVDFDKLYYESETYLLGREEVLKGLDQGIFFQKEDGSIWVDLTEEGLDQKLLLRADGTSVYMTQDIGTAILRYRDFPAIIKQIYTVGNEQEYHFKVLFLILAKLGYEWALECYHLSYGMVDLPSGRMKSREGKVVDADDLMDEMIATAEGHTRELGKIEGFSPEEARELYEMLGLGALKYFLLKVDPKKRMLFDPEESIQFQGNTAPFIQYTHARISAILRKADQLNIPNNQVPASGDLHEVESYLIKMLYEYSSKVKDAGQNYAPDIIAQYTFDLAKEYNRFYQEIAIFNEENENLLRFRVALSSVTARVIRHAMGLLGINVPEQM